MVDRITVNDVIKEIDEIKPNVFPESVKTRWLSECESEIRLRTGGTSVRLKYPEDGEHELSVPHPYDKLYYHYLEAAIDFRTKDYAGYENSAAAYNEALTEYLKYYERSKSSSWKEANNDSQT